jgi:hypothetical protein
MLPSFKEYKVTLKMTPKTWEFIFRFLGPVRELVGGAAGRRKHLPQAFPLASRDVPRCDVPRCDVP